MTNETNTHAEAFSVESQNVQLQACVMGCSICGMDEWCGSDGCPLDPQ